MIFPCWIALYNELAELNRRLFHFRLIWHTQVRLPCGWCRPDRRPSRYLSKCHLVTSSSRLSTRGAHCVTSSYLRHRLQRPRLLRPRWRQRRLPQPASTSRRQRRLLDRQQQRQPQHRRRRRPFQPWRNLRHNNSRTTWEFYRSPLRRIHLRLPRTM